MRETAAPLPRKSSPWSKGHCDFLLDRIDAQLVSLQGPRLRIKGNRWDGPLQAASRTAGGERDVSSQEMDCRGQLLPLPDPKEAPSRSESTCTEDLATEFHKGLVDLLLSSDEEEPPSGLVSRPRDGRPPMSSVAVLSERAGPCPTFRSPHPALDSRRWEPTFEQLPVDASKEKRRQEWAPLSREHLLPQHGVKNMASLGEKVPIRRKSSAKSSSGTDVGRGGQPWKSSDHTRVQNSREEGGFSRNSGFLESERGGGGGEGREPSSEPRETITRRSKHRSVVGEPRSSWRRARRTASTIRVPPRRAEEVSPPEKTSSEHPGGQPLRGCCGNPLPPLHGEDQRILPHTLCPPKARLLGGKESLPPSELGTDPGVMCGPRDAQRPPGLARRLKETWAAAWSTEVLGEVPERGETDGRNGKKPLLPPKDPWRSSSSGVSDADEEGFAQLSGQSRRTSGNFRRWKEGAAGNYKLNQHVALELDNFQEALQERQELGRRLELQMEEHQDKAEKARADLVLLEYKREICRSEVVELEKKLSQLRRQGRQYGALQVEALLSKKDLEIARMHEIVLDLEVEKEALDGRVRRQKEENQQQLKKLQQEALQEKEKELCKLREEMELQEKRAVRECAESSEVAKASALGEQAVTFQKEIENLQKILKEQEAGAIQQKEAMEKQATALKVEADQMVEKTLHQEQKKWEANAQAALQMQREVLEEQDRRRWADLQRTLEEEREVNHALRNEEADLRQKIKSLEKQVRGLEEEKRASLEELQAGLQKEKDEALQRLREELEEERMQEREEMRTKLRQMEERGEHLQEECSRMSLREREAKAETDRMDHFWATQVTLACQQLQELLPEKATLLPHLLCRGAPPLSSGAALQVLRGAKEEIQSYVQDLNHELERRSQRILQIQREKEVELKQQKKQLHLESQSVLEALKEHLVQEHLSDILTLQRSWLKEGQEKEKSRWGPSPEGKVGELRAAQENVARGKDKAKPMPINHPKEALDREPEGCLSSKNPATPGSEGRRFSTGRSQRHPSGTLCSPSLGTNQNHLPNSGVLHHLQNRIWKLRAENGGYLGGAAWAPQGASTKGGEALGPPQEERGESRGFSRSTDDGPTVTEANSSLRETPTAKQNRRPGLSGSHLCVQEKPTSHLRERGGLQRQRRRPPRFCIGSP